MKRVRSKFGLVCSGLLSSCLAAAPAAAGVVVSFSGTVEEITAFGATPPAGVSVGDPVSGTVSYMPGDSQGVETEPSDWSYAFNLGDQNVMRFTIGAQTWTTPLTFVHVCDEACSGDALSFGGITISSSGFPGFLDNGVLTVEYGDSVEPYDIVSGIDVPDATQDVDFSAADFTLGSIGSTSSTGGWAISFTPNNSTLPVKTQTWSQVKQLYARP